MTAMLAVMQANISGLSLQLLDVPLQVPGIFLPICSKTLLAQG